MDEFDLMLKKAPNLTGFTNEEVKQFFKDELALLENSICTRHEKPRAE